jgi:hypothetical protein
MKLQGGDLVCLSVPRRCVCRCDPALTLVFGELHSETFLGVRNPLHGGRGNLELSIAQSASSNGGNLTQPFDNPKIAFLHA